MHTSVQDKPLWQKVLLVALAVTLILGLSPAPLLANRAYAAEGEGGQLAAGAIATQADGATIESVRTAIQALSADPTSFTAADKESVEAIWTDFQALSAEDQATLDAECTHSDTGQSLGRVLESALWSVWSYETDTSTTLADGTYDTTTTPAVSSESSKGKSDSSRVRNWWVESVEVTNGQAMATIYVTAGDATAKKVTSYPSVWAGGVSYPKSDADTYTIPVDLNGTTYFSGISSSMASPIMYSLSTTIEEPAPVEPADPIDVYMTVSDKGTLALAREKVTVSDIDENGTITLDEALAVTHEKYCPAGKDGYATKWDEDLGSLSVIKFWGVSTINVSFCKNDRMTAAVDKEILAEGDDVVASLLADDWGLDNHAYFDKKQVSVAMDEEFELELSTFNILTVMFGGDYEIEAAADVQVGTWEDGDFTPIKGKVTGEDGKVALSFDEPGTYVVSAFADDYGDSEVPLTAPVCIVNVAADPIDVFMTVSNKGTLALAREVVTVADIDSNGSITLDEALIAAHKQYCSAGEDGYATKPGEWGLQVTKLWGVESTTNMFYKNDVSTNSVDLETVAADDDIVASVMADSTSWSDCYGYFDKKQVSVAAGEEFTLVLKADSWGTALNPSGIQVGTWKDGAFTAIEGKKVGTDGKVTLSFPEGGTYVVSANGNVAQGTYGATNCPLTAPVCIVTVAADPIDVYVTVSNKGTLALVRQHVTVADIDKNGFISLDEALFATHETYCPAGEGGYATQDTEYGRQVTKLWGVESTTNMFYKNDVSTNSVDLETVAADDDIVASVMADSTSWSDCYGYFDKKELSAEAGEEFELTLKADSWGTTVDSSGVQIGTWKDGKFAPIEGKTTGEGGKVSLSFDELGTYVVSASGTVAENAYGQKDCPLSAPVCVVKVVEPVELAITNNTGMFKAVTASAIENPDGSARLTFALSSNGYHYLYKGTYEQAVANGDATENWVAGYQNAAGKWEFQIPIAADELGKDVPVVAVSQSYYEKYQNGENPIARAFYPRQVNLDFTAATLTTGDYKASKAIAVTNNVKMFKPGETATLNTVGGPNSNGYKAELVLPMQNTTYSEVYVGTPAEAEAADETIAFDSEAMTFTIPVLGIETFGQPETIWTYCDGETFIISFKSSKGWYGRLATLDAEAGTLVFDPVADTEALAAAIADAEAAQAEATASADGSDVAKDAKWVPEDVAKALSDALAAAREVFGNAAATQAAVDEAKDALVAATSAFRDAEKAGTKPEFKPATGATRLWGQKALDTMAEIVKTGFADGSCDAVVVASADGYWDALAASSLAGKLGCPVLMTNPKSLSSQTLSEIKRLGAKKAYIAGGELAVEPAVEKQLKAKGLTVKRLWGDDAQATAVKIAQELGSDHAPTCVIATSDGYWDALSASPYAYAFKAPVFLTDSKGALRADTLAAIKAGGYTSAVIAGGELVVSPDTPAALRAAGVTSFVVRCGGTDAYETASKLAEWEMAQGMGVSRIGVATSKNGYWDALSGAALCGANNSVLLLADGGRTTYLEKLLSYKASQVEAVYVFGGEFAVDPSVDTAIAKALKANAG